VDSEEVELTSFGPREFQTTNDGNHNDQDQNESNMSSTEALHRPHDSEDVDLAIRSSPLQASGNRQEYSSIPTNDKRRSATQRIGTHSVMVLAATTTLMLAVFSFLTFLWSASQENNFWCWIIVKGFAGGAVTVSSVVLRTAVDLQAGIAVAMLAAILLEADHVLLVDTAHVSRLRAGRAMPLDIMMPSLRAMQLGQRKGLCSYVQITGILLLLATTVLLQLTSTILVSDLSLGTLPSMPSREDIMFDLAYRRHYDAETDHVSWESPYLSRATSTWLWNPPAFPTFAEFSEPIKVPEHVDDTGHLLRALLPFQDPHSRETISGYSGDALVFDARVSCQRPQLFNESLTFDVVNGHGAYIFAGWLTTTEEVPQLSQPGGLNRFKCTIGGENVTTQHVLSICQVDHQYPATGILLSDLWTAKQWLSANARYNDTVGAVSVRSTLLTINVTAEGNNDSSVSVTSGHGAWTDLEYVDDHHENGTELLGYKYFHKKASVSLCYPASWTATLDVTLHSSKGRTEPTALPLDEGNWYRTEPDVHFQMGEYTNGDDIAYVTCSLNVEKDH